MRYAQASFAAAVLPAARACVDPKTHACASAFHNNLASAQEFCATYTAGSAASVPSLFSSACQGEAKSLSKECTCYATGSAAVATGTPAPIYTSANATGSIASTFVTATSAAAASSVPSATSVASNYSAAATTTAAVKVAAAAAGGTAISSLAGGSGVGGTTCTVTELADVTASLESCSNVLMSGVSIPASSTLSVEVSSDAALLFAGTMTVAYTPDTDHTPIVIKGTGAKVAGVAGAVIDGHGAQYWDGEGSNGGSDKPDHFIKIDDMEDSTLSDLTIQNWPTHLFEITGCSNMEMYNLILDNSAGDEADSDGDSLGHNTDAFDVSSTDGLYVHDATVYNQDDCTAVNSGSNMVFENLYCSGGHGLSIGSIKSDVTVSNITFKDSTVINSANGCRIKTVADATDSTVADITYSNIYLSGITDDAIDVQQDYENGGSTGDPGDSITISGVTFEDVTGSVADDDAYQYYILCGSPPAAPTSPGPASTSRVARPSALPMATSARRRSGALPVPEMESRVGGGRAGGLGECLGSSWRRMIGEPKGSDLSLDSSLISLSWFSPQTVKSMPEFNTGRRAFGSPHPCHLGIPVLGVMTREA